MSLQCVALLGRKDVPTDAVEEYCRYLGEALEGRGIQLDVRRVPWEIHGWKAALQTLPLMARQWRGQWVFVQYTALAWSARGFPQKILRVIAALRANGARVAVVFHDVEPYAGSRIVDRIRRRTQMNVMRRLVKLSELAIFTVPVETISWLGSRPGNVAFVPVGPNLPIPENPVNRQKAADIPTIGVFSITGGAAGDVETQTILSAVRKAAQSIGRVKLDVFGRHAELREKQLRKGIEGLPVELSVEGVVDPADVVERLGRCDVALFVRGAISTRRSSAIAAIACGRPVIAYKGTETAGPIIEAGVVLISPGDTNAIGDALTKVLTDETLRRELAERSRSAFESYFSWRAIAARYVELLGNN
jgi:glycosyltransferase involved in cell wall biosynthesis